MTPAPGSPWGLRYSVRDRDGIVRGTVTVHLRKVPAGSSPLEVARHTLNMLRPGATPILPRAVLLYPGPSAALELEAVA